MSIGIKNFFRLGTDLVVTSNNTLQTIPGFTVPIGAGESLSGQARIPFTVGATGGIQVKVSAPATSDFNTNLVLSDCVTPASIRFISLTGAVFANAFAVAGNSFIILEFSLIASAAGNVTLQVAQNTSDPLSLTIQAGTYWDVTKL